MKNKEIKIFLADGWVDYELLDTGEGEKLERVGEYTFVRPYEDAVWSKTLSKSEWAEIAGKFWSSSKGAKAGWKMNGKIRDHWEISYRDIKFFTSPTPFRHYGFFPEQASHWEFIQNKIKQTKKPVKFLNLFGYTGIASLFALRAGAEVTHVDASKTSIAWAKENQVLSGLDELPMRVIEDDVLKFLEKEIKRGNKYDAVIMDPPKFGRGPKGETWKIENDLSRLLESVKKVLTDKPLFVIITSYAIDASSLSLGEALRDTMKNFDGEVTQGELCLLEKSLGHRPTGETKNRVVSLANTAVWQTK